MLERQILGAFLAGGAALGVFAWGKHGYSERDQVVQWAKIQCAAAGAPYAPAKGKPGEVCGRAIANLVDFRSQTNAASAQILADALADQNTRNTRAAEQARQAADAARAAAEHMEAVNDQVQSDDRVGRDWFDALNRTGGLRDPQP